jgi:hypothetical protein
MVVVALAVCIPFLASWFLLKTDYAPGFSKRSFQQVKSGDTVAAVFERLREPLNVVVEMQQQEGRRFELGHSDDVSMLSKWTNDESVLLTLRYSKPRTPGGSYHAYEVSITKGKVMETRAYIYWD